MTRHLHLLVRATLKNPPQDQTLARLQLQDLIDSIDMRTLSGPHSEYVYTKGNQGMTVSAIIETSHIVLHTWDETDPALAQLDVYSCKAYSKNTVFEWFKQYDPVELEYKWIDRENGLETIERSDPR